MIAAVPEWPIKNGKIHRAVRGPNSFSPVRPNTPSLEEVLCRNLANNRQAIFPKTLG